MKKIKIKIKNAYNLNGRLVIDGFIIQLVSNITKQLIRNIVL